MRARVLTILAGLLALPLAATAETWKNVPVIDTLCLAKVKADTLAGHRGGDPQGRLGQGPVGHPRLK